jgi:hypothetical protein
MVAKLAQNKNEMETDDDQTRHQSRLLDTHNGMTLFDLKGNWPVVAWTVCLSVLLTTWATYLATRALVLNTYTM